MVTEAAINHIKNNNSCHVNGPFLILLSLQVSTVPQESRTLKSTVPEGAELQAECLLVRQVSVFVCVGGRGVCVHDLTEATVV